MLFVQLTILGQSQAGAIWATIMMMMCIMVHDEDNEELMRKKSVRVGGGCADKWRPSSATPLN